MARYPKCWILKEYLYYFFPLFVGRYNKYSRNLSQTPWLIEGQRKTESSMQEIICDPIQDLFKASGEKIFCNRGPKPVSRCSLLTEQPMALFLFHKQLLARFILRTSKTKWKGNWKCAQLLWKAFAVHIELGPISLICYCLKFFCLAKKEKDYTCDMVIWMVTLF